MRSVPLLLVLLLSACAASEPAVTRAPGLTPAGPAAARLVAAAERESREWGNITVEGWPVALDRTPDATPALFERLMTYWTATPDGPGIIAGHRHFRDTINVPSAITSSLTPVGLSEPMPVAVGISSFNTPAWSAAFISHAMREASVSGFIPASAHALYLDRLLAHWVADPSGAPFVPRDPANYAPRPGDLVCWDRSADRLPNWEARLAERGRSRPMHCDIIVAAGSGRAEMIGGNALDVVLRRRVPTDAQGVLTPPPLERPPYLVVMQNRG